MCSALKEHESRIQVPQKRLAFHRHAQRNAFRRFDARQQSTSFVRSRPALTRSPTPTGFAEIVSR
jgi:hypothetical protein